MATSGLPTSNTVPVTDTTPPIPSNNCLGDVIKWLKRGDIVEMYNLHSNVKLCYQVPGTEPCRFISIDTTSIRDLLADGEWPWYIGEYAKAKLIPTPQDKEKYFVYYFKLPPL